MNSPSDYPLTLKLKHPFQFGSELITQIHYRRPKAKDLKSIKPDELEMGDILGIFAKISDQAPPVIDELDAEDSIHAIEVVSGFLGAGQKIGK